jgi:hypothetical protein
MVARTVTRALPKYIRDDTERERERSVYLATLSIAMLASMIAERNTSMEQWWNDKDRRNPK